MRRNADHCHGAPTVLPAFLLLLNTLGDAMYLETGILVLGSTFRRVISQFRELRLQFAVRDLTQRAVCS